jgi:hypothetical protein
LIAGNYARIWAAWRVARPQNKEDVRVFKILSRRRIEGLPFAGKAQMEELLSDMDREYPALRARLEKATPERGPLRSDGLI